MPRFDNRDVAFDAPDAWEDRTVIAFEAPKPHGVPFATNVTLMRAESKAIPLATFASQQIANLAAGLPKFELVSQKNVTFGGLPAIELLFHWAPPDGGITQRITIFERKGAIWSFTASAMRTAFAQQLPTFEKIIASIQFAAGPAGPPSGGSLPPARTPSRNW